MKTKKAKYYFENKKIYMHHSNNTSIQLLTTFLVCLMCDNSDARKIAQENASARLEKKYKKAKKKTRQQKK